MKDEEIKLQPLRIPAGWKVNYNKFFDIEPSDLQENDINWIDFTEDILQMEYKYKDIYIIIDLGWYPDIDPNGNFRLVVVKDEGWEKPLVEILTKNKMEIVENLENLLKCYS